MGIYFLSKVALTRVSSYTIGMDELRQRYPDLITEDTLKDISRAASEVRLHRDYVMGEQYVYLTEGQRRMLNIQTANYRMFNANYCEMIVRIMSDRLTIAEFLTDTDPDWVSDWRKRIGIDALQIDLHEAVLREGDAFLLADYDETNHAILKLNYAFDGKAGVIPFYDGERLIAAIKVWQDGDRLDSERWEPDEVVHFAHRRIPGRSRGVSEVASIISLQDALNRIIASMIIAGELSAFQILFAKGFIPPNSIEPGVIISAPDASPEKLSVVDLKSIEQGSLQEYISEIDRVVDLISEITQTPILARIATANASGEALKQREIGLLGKVRAAQVKLGEAWEDALRMSARLDGLYAGGPGEIAHVQTRWESPEVRNKKESIELAVQLFDKLADKELLIEMVGEILDWTAERQEELIERVQEADKNRMRELAAMTIPPDFGGDNGRTKDSELG